MTASTSISCLDIFPFLSRRYSGQLNPALAGLNFYRQGDQVFLELVYNETAGDIIRDDLAFIADDDHPEDHSKSFFDLGQDFVDAAMAFVEFDPYTIIMCGDIFSKEAEAQIAAQAEGRS